VSSSRWHVEVIVMPKDGVSDPQGESVRGGLATLGHGQVGRVRVGRHIELELSAESEGAARDAVARMAEQLLANPVIEQYRIETVAELKPQEVR
jgi:phosphoribosylformylglycinamidine synthase